MAYKRMHHSPVALDVNGCRHGLDAGSGLILCVTVALDPADRAAVALDDAIKLPRLARYVYI